MADLHGPGGLPGQVSNTPTGMKCDDCGQPATVRVQGETDSFGSEQHDLCDACERKMREECRDSSGRCDYCKADVSERIWTRDYEEGLGGPVYHICRPCYQRQQDRINEDLADYDDWGDYDDGCGDDE